MDNLDDERPWPGCPPIREIINAALERGNFAIEEPLDDDTVDAFLWRLRADANVDPYDPPSCKEAIGEAAGALLRELRDTGAIARPRKIWLKGIIRGTGMAFSGNIGYDVLVGDPDSNDECVLIKNMEFGPDDVVHSKEAGSKCLIGALEASDLGRPAGAALLGIFRYSIARDWIIQRNA